MRMFSADDSFELSEEEFLQAALDIETLCPETRQNKRTSFELGIETIQPCSGEEKTQTTTSPASGQLSPGSYKYVGQILSVGLNITVEDGKLLKKDVSDSRYTPDGGRGSNARPLMNEVTFSGSHLSRAHQINDQAHPNTLAYNDSGKTLQNDLFSLNDLCSDPDFSIDNGHSPGWNCGPKAAKETVSSSYDMSQLCTVSASADMSHVTADPVRKTSLGARCLELLRAKDQRQNPVERCNNPLPRQTAPTPMSHDLEVGRSETVGQFLTPGKRSSVLTEAVLTPHEAPGREGPAHPGSSSLRATKKRKFPGPAGKLPQLSSGDTFDGMNTKMVKSCLSPVAITLAQADDICDQSCEALFQDVLWLQMISELETEARVLSEQFSVTAVIRKASKKQLPRGKVPVMCVLIDMISVQHTADASVLLRDQTGVMKGTVHQQLMRDYPDHFQPGTALVLRQVGVFSPSVRTHYLNITPNNIVCTYRKSADGSTVVDRYNKFAADDFLLSGANDSTLLTPSHKDTATVASSQALHKSRTIPQTPPCNRSTPQTPSCNRTMPQTPSCNRTMPQTPSCNRTMPQTPSCNRTTPQTPSCNRTTPQTPSCNMPVPKVADEGKRDFERCPVKAAWPATGQGRKESLIEPPSNEMLDDLLTGLDNEMLDDF